MPCSSDTVSQNLAPVKMEIGTEHRRRRGTATAIAHRFDYRTVEVREISIKRGMRWQLGNSVEHDYLPGRFEGERFPAF